MTNIISPQVKYVELMLERTLNNKTLAKNLFEKLFSSLRIQLNDLSLSLRENDLEKAQFIAHDINGVVANCGLINLEYYAQVMNKFLSENDIINAQKFFQIFKQQADSMLDCQDDILSLLKEWE